MMKVFVIAIFASFSISVESVIVARLEHDRTFYNGTGCEPVHGFAPDENCMYQVDDMMFTKEEIIDAFANDRNGIRGSNYRWPNKEMAYVFDGKTIKSGSNEEKFIKRVIARFNIDLKGCLKISEKRSWHSSYVKIEKDGLGCSSYVGKYKPGQEVSIGGNVGGSGCFHDGVVIHELIHAWGFHHEQQRADRHHYVRYYEGNVKNEDLKGNFVQDKNSDDYGVPYDGLSIMHYFWNQFSKNPNLRTLKSLRTDLFTDQQMGTNNWMTAGDVSKLRQMYGCDKGSCRNKRSDCDKLVSKGVCQYQGNGNWGADKCKSSCNFCNGQCTDTWKYCKSYATKNGCFQPTQDLLWATRMQTYCRKTCNMCPTNCKDNDYFPRYYYNGKQTFKTCAEWAKMGKLKCNERFFLNNCRKTCKMCLGQIYAPQGPTSSRSDQELPEFSEDQDLLELPNEQEIPEFSEYQDLPEDQELPEFSDNQDLPKLPEDQDLPEFSDNQDLPELPEEQELPEFSEE